MNKYLCIYILKNKCRCIYRYVYFYIGTLSCMENGQKIRQFYKIVTNQSPTSKNIWDMRCWAWWCTGQCPCHLHLKHTEMCLEINLP